MKVRLTAALIGLAVLIGIFVWANVIRHVRFVQDQRTAMSAQSVITKQHYAERAAVEKVRLEDAELDRLGITGSARRHQHEMAVAAAMKELRRVQATNFTTEYNIGSN